MSAEKLPPDGYELGPGWSVIRGDVPILCDEHDRYHARYCHEDAREVIDKAVCVDVAEAMGAIVRKAEAPTFEQLVAKVGPLASTAMASAEAPQILQPESLPNSENITSPANHYLAAEAPSPVVAPRSRMPDAPAHVSTWKISSLTPDKIIYELDGPRIFTSRDQYNRMLLAYLHAEHGSTSSYFVVPCSDNTVVVPRRRVPRSFALDASHSRRSRCRPAPGHVGGGERTMIARRRPVALGRPESGTGRAIPR